MDTPPPSLVRLPCLAFNRGKYLDAPVLFSLSERKSVASNMEELRGSTAWATAQGWFLVRHAHATFLWNPSNGDKIQLPPLHEDVPAQCNCLLSDKPTVVVSSSSSSNNGSSCVVLLLDKMDPIMWYCHVGTGGGWTRHEYDIGTQILSHDPEVTEKLVIAPATSCHGKFYFPTGFEELGVIEFRPAPAFSSIAMREVITGGYGVAHKALDFMVESKGQVHMVILLFEGSFSRVVYEISVYRMDFSSQEWRRVYDLEGQAFLLSSVRFGASRPADECGLEEDCVYVAYQWDKGLMIYNIREGTMKLENLDEAPESAAAGRPLWMLPADP